MGPCVGGAGVGPCVGGAGVGPCVGGDTDDTKKSQKRKKGSTG